MEEDKWIVQKSGKWSGPFSETQIRGYVEKGVLDGSELVRNKTGQPLPIHEAFPPANSTDAQTSSEPDESGKQAKSSIFSTIWNELKTVRLVEDEAPKRERDVHLLERDANTPPPSASVSDSYGKLEVVSGCYFIAGILGLVGGAFLLFAGLGDGKVDLAAAGGAVLGSSIACFGVGFFFKLVIDLARNSHRQTVALEKLAGIAPPPQKQSPARDLPAPDRSSGGIRE